MDKKHVLFISPSLVLFLFLFLYPNTIMGKIVLSIIAFFIIALTYLQVKQGWHYLAITISKYMILMLLLLIFTITVTLFSGNFLSSLPRLIEVSFQIFRGLVLLLFTFSQPVFIVYEYHYFINTEKR